MGEFISDFSVVAIGLFLLAGVGAMGILPIIRRWGEQTMKIHRPTEREKIDANADRLRRFDASGWRCVRCGKSPPEHGDYLQLAHRLRKGLVSKYGADVVHHGLSAVPSCSRCNQLLLVHGEEERALVARIRGILAGSEFVDLRAEYRAIRESFESAGYHV